jgi:peptidyl-prolyl cis-trans isomerase C
VQNSLTRLAKEPLIQFLLLGACIYGAYALYGAPDEDSGDRTVLVDTARIGGFVSGWQSRFNRPPTDQELDGMISQFVREDIFYREAVAMGLDEDDTITRRRMAQKLEFLTKDIARLKEPAEGELEQYFEDNKALYREPDLITFSHVFLDPDKRDETTLDDAAALLAELEAAGEPDAETLNAGDRFMLQSYYPEKSELDVRRQLGSGFAESVMQLEPGQWHGPVLSGYGVHLVYVHDFRAAPAPVFADVEEYVLENWKEVQQEEFNEQYFESLKSRYDIVIEAPPVAPDSPRQADSSLREGVDDSAVSGVVAEPAS